MKFILSFILLTIITTSGCFAGEAFFRPMSRQKIELVEGDSFKGVIELWNIDNISPEMISELEQKSFLDNFFIIKLSKPYWAESNPEVVLIEGLFVLQKSLKEKDKVWELGGLKINVKLKEFETSSFTKKKKGFVVLEGDYNLSEESIYKYIIPAALILLLFILWLVLRKKKKESLVVAIEPTVNWKEEFLAAGSKDDFSKIYNNKDAWIIKLESGPAVADEFVQTAKQYLFKKDVEDYEIEELKVLIEPISKEIRE